MSCRLELRHQVLSDAELILHAPKDDRSCHSRVRHAASGWRFISLTSHQVPDNLITLPRIRIFLWAFAIGQYNLHTILFTPHSRHIYGDRRSCSRSQGGRRNANFRRPHHIYHIEFHRIGFGNIAMPHAKKRRRRTNLVVWPGSAG